MSADISEVHPISDVRREFLEPTVALSGDGLDAKWQRHVESLQNLMKQPSALMIPRENSEVFESIFRRCVHLCKLCQYHQSQLAKYSNQIHMPRDYTRSQCRF